MTDPTKPTLSQSNLSPKFDQGLPPAERDAALNRAPLVHARAASIAQMGGNGATAQVAVRLPQKVRLSHDFLAHYESFIEQSIQDPLLWQSDSSDPQTPSTPTWTAPQLRLALIGAISAIAGTSGLLFKSVAQTPWTSKAAPQPSVESQAGTEAPAPTLSAPIVEVAPEKFPPSSAPVQIPRVVSPPIRAPLPGQAISQQSLARLNRR